MTRRLIQFASDLHLEHRINPSFEKLLRPVPTASALFLAGDIGWPTKRSYRDFMAYCSQRWPRVFVVAGNHELYNNKPLVEYAQLRHADTASERIARAAEVCSEFPNVDFLNRRRVDWDGVAVLGTTLWTGLEGLTPAQLSSVNDYMYIAVGEEDTQKYRLSPEDTQTWHLDERAWLASEIAAATATSTPVVVLTHHLPTSRLVHAKFASHPLTTAYAANCDDLFTPTVRGWIAGHSHCGNRIRLPGNGIAALNPCGYPGERDTDYDPSCVAELFVGEDHRDPLLVAAAGPEEDIM